MNFTSNTQEELQLLSIIDGNEYLIEYKNKDYFNGEETIERTKAKALINNNQILFIVPDPYGMDRFISDVKILQF
ncbi:MAG: hypothetical protein PHY66_08195 [Aliarcobacter sp.]|nr:hypothetical protein [Aliarcobacter sp.]MDD2887770.1 hypothetical protein [Aliarcobacter sp.]